MQARIQDDPNAVGSPDPTLTEDNTRLWPSHTDLVVGPSHEYTLGVQSHEVKAIVRKAIPFVLVNICFVEFFPSSTTRAAWSKKALIGAAKDLKTQSARINQAAALRYDAVMQRLMRDDDYYPVLGKLVRLASLKFAYS